MTGAKKAAPRSKAVSFTAQRYRVLHTSFINGSLHHPGDEVHLPDGVKAGANLEAIEAKEAESGQDGKAGSKKAPAGDK